VELAEVEVERVAVALEDFRAEVDGALALHQLRKEGLLISLLLVL
jgi:hypothetical protein